MQSDSLRSKLSKGKSIIGCFVNIDSPAIVEILAVTGIEFVVVDCEHSTITPSGAEAMYRAAELRGMPAITRVGENTQQVIQKFMDSGSRGIQTPLVNSAEEAIWVVDAVKYPPLGKRGLAGVRSNEFGIGAPLNEHVKRANEDNLVVVQIETIEGIAAADEIIGVDGVDVVFLGPTDISVSFGLHGQVKHPRVLEAIENLSRKISAAGKAPGTIARNAEDIAYWREREVRYFLTSSTALIAAGASQFIKSTRDAIDAF
jgi:4-hydroxy-2-oxoheptanedioate aldolase